MPRLHTAIATVSWSAVAKYFWQHQKHKLPLEITASHLLLRVQPRAMEDLGLVSASAYCLPSLYIWREQNLNTYSYSPCRPLTSIKKTVNEGRAGQRPQQLTFMLTATKVG